MLTGKLHNIKYTQIYKIRARKKKIKGLTQGCTQWL